MSYLFITYNIIISWLYTRNGFRIIFLLRDRVTQEYIIITNIVSVKLIKFRIVETVNHLEMQFFPNKSVECRRPVLHIIGS